MIYLLSTVFLSFYTDDLPHMALGVCVCVSVLGSIVRFNCRLSEGTFQDVLLATCNSANKFTWHWTLYYAYLWTTYLSSFLSAFILSLSFHWQFEPHYWKIDEIFRQSEPLTYRLSSRATQDKWLEFLFAPPLAKSYCGLCGAYNE